MAVFARQTATAQKLIKKNGRTVVLRKAIAAAQDPLKPWIQTPASVVDYNVTIAVFPFDARSSDYKTKAWSKKFGDVPIGLSQAYMPRESVEPSIDDVMIFDGKTYSVLDIDKLSPNGEVILYNLTLKE